MLWWGFCISLTLYIAGRYKDGMDSFKDKLGHIIIYGVLWFVFEVYEQYFSWTLYNVWLCLPKRSCLLELRIFMLSWFEMWIFLIAHQHRSYDRPVNINCSYDVVDITSARLCIFISTSCGTIFLSDLFSVCLMLVTKVTCVFAAENSMVDRWVIYQKYSRLVLAVNSLEIHIWSNMYSAIAGCYKERIREVLVNNSVIWGAFWWVLTISKYG